MAGIDVVIPNYRYGRFLRSCVASIQQQGVEDLRILIIDNASDDDSVDIARDLAQRDHRIEVRARPKNLGRVASQNEGLDWAQAEYFTIVCADDLLFPGGLASAVDIMNADSEIAFSYGRVAIFEDGEPPRIDPRLPAANWSITSGDDYLWQCCSRPKGTCVMLTRTTAHKVAGYYRESAGLMDDLEMHFRLACLGRVAVSQTYMALHRVHQSNISASFSTDRLQWLKSTQQAFDSFFANEGARHPDAVKLQHRAHDCLAARAYWTGLSKMLLGRISEGRNLFRFAYAMNPSCALLPPVSYLLSTHQPFQKIMRAALAASKECLTAAKPQQTIHKSPSIDKSRSLPW